MPSSRPACPHLEMLSDPPALKTPESSNPAEGAFLGRSSLSAPGRGGVTLECSQQHQFKLLLCHKPQVSSIHMQVFHSGSPGLGVPNCVLNNKMWMLKFRDSHTATSWWSCGSFCSSMAKGATFFPLHLLLLPKPGIACSASHANPSSCSE